MLTAQKNLIFAKAAAAKENFNLAKTNPSYPFLSDLFKYHVMIYEMQLDQKMQISQEKLRLSLHRYTILAQQVPLTDPIPRKSNPRPIDQAYERLDIEERELLSYFIEAEKTFRFLTCKINNAIYELDSQEAIRWAKEHPTYPVKGNPVITSEIANIFNKPPV